MLPRRRDEDVIDRAAAIYFCRARPPLTEPPFAGAMSLTLTFLFVRGFFGAMTPPLNHRDGGEPECSIAASASGGVDRRV